MGAFFLMVKTYFPLANNILVIANCWRCLLGKRIFTVLKVLVLAYVLTGLLMLLSAFIMYKLKLSTEHSRLFVMVIYGIVTIVSGLLYGKIKEKRRLFNGAFIGLLYFMVLLLVSLVVNKGLTDSLQSNIISMIICVAGGSIGGIIS